MSTLRGSIVAVQRLSTHDRDQMFTVFARYYSGVTRTVFDKDLDAKNDVILLRDDQGDIRGFSTLLKMTVRHGGRTHYGIFSGDTVVDRPFWGTRVLGHCFLRYLFIQRLRRPWSPLWWFLISKGYKTYLIMANNFPEHWPRHEQDTPADRQALLDAFAQTSFSDAYDPDSGLLRFPESAGQLREGVAAACSTLIAGNERVRFFVERNPFRYAAKAARKQVARSRKLILGSAS
jgi:hypothetical protein